MAEFRIIDEKYFDAVVGAGFAPTHIEIKRENGMVTVQDRYSYEQEQAGKKAKRKKKSVDAPSKNRMLGDDAPIKKRTRRKAGK